MSGTNQATTLSAIDVLTERKSVRQYERGVVIPKAELDELLTLAAAAPSSWNLQQWRFIVIESQAEKDALLPIAYGQKQVSDASVVIVLLADTEANVVGRANLDKAVAAGHLKAEIRDSLAGQFDGAYQNAQYAREEGIKNAAFAGMQLMLAAKAKGYDSVPMGGYNQQALIDHLNIPARYVPVMLLPIGKAAAPGRPSSRMGLDELVLEVK